MEVSGPEVWGGVRLPSPLLWSELQTLFSWEEGPPDATHLLTTYCVPIILPVIMTASLWGMHHWAHIWDGKTEAQGHDVM